MTAMKQTVLSVALIAAAAIPALAQSIATSPPAATPSPPKLTTIDRTNAGSEHFSASNLIGAAVLNNANESIGDINDMLLSKTGNVASVVVGVGGFLGIGEKLVALPFDELSFMRDNQGAVVIVSKVTKETLQAMPEWKAPNKAQR